MNNHPWHNVSVGDEAPHTVNTIIEISRGSKAKYEVDKATGLLRLDRVLHAAFYYPINYGFIPNTNNKQSNIWQLFFLLLSLDY